jgi:hypothetical protein
VVPASARRLRVVGEPGLEAAVREAGFEVAADGRDADAVLVDSGGGAPPPAPATAAPVAIVVDSGSPAGPRGPWRRAAALASAAPRSVLARRGARRAAGGLRAAGPIRLLPMSDRSRTVYGLGGGLWRRGLVPVAAIVRSAGEPSVLDAAIARSEVALRRRLELRAMTVVESGKLLAELRDERGGAYVLRVAGGPSAEYVEASLRTLTALARSDVPPEVRALLPVPLLDGRIGAARFSLEPKLAGRHPLRLTSELERRSAEFLVALHGHGPGERGDAERLRRRLHPSVRVLAPLSGAAERLEELAAAMGERLAGLRLGWGHGDFWFRNLLVRRGRLTAVLDWDTASPAAFPAHDLWDLATLGVRAGRNRGPGERCAELLWPLARAGGDERTRAHLTAVGAPGDERTVGALALAYWLTRTARSVQEVPYRAVDGPWIERNVRRPLQAAGGL